MRTLSAAVLLAVTIAGSGCGGSKGGGGPVDPTPNPDPATQTVNGNVASFAYNEHPLNASRTGNLTVTLTWSGSTDLDLYLTPGNCPDIYGANACTRLVVSEQLVGNSEVVTRAVQSGEQFKIWVDNFAVAAQPYTLTIEIR